MLNARPTTNTGGVTRLQVSDKPNRTKMLLLTILLLSAFLTVFRIWDTAYGNMYYTAAVKSMLTSWHNFLFVSFDPAGFISVDKPPLGLWLQCLFALVFGVHGWSVILPQALCTVGSVAVLYKIVKRGFGETCGLLAALLMTLTPVVAAVSRTNNLDAPLVLVCLLALWALLAAAERGSLKLLILSAALIGVGFNIKMLQAFMFVPAIYLVYAFTSPVSVGKRAAHLAAATVVLAAVSLSWCLIVDVTPASQRPFVGSSSTNSAMELAIGYNGLLRALPLDNTAWAGANTAISSVPNEGAAPGVFRLLNKEMAGQAGWFLPLAVFGLAALLLSVLKKNGPAARQPALRQLLLWAGLFVPMAVYFSISTHIHRYYLIMFAPALAALAAVAVTQFYTGFVRNGVPGRPRWRVLALPLALAVTAAVQAYVLKVYYTRFSQVLLPVMSVTAGAAVVLLIVSRFIIKNRPALSRIAAVVAVAGLCAAPAVWAWAPIKYGVNVVTPYGGPPAVSMPTDNGKPQPVMDSWEKKWFAGKDLYGELLPEDIVEYIVAHDNGARYLLSVPNVIFAAPILLHHDVSVMAIGGYVGNDRSITLNAFKQLVYDGQLHYYYDLPGQNVQISSWVRANGWLLDPAEFSAEPWLSFFSIYDLSGLES